MYGTTALVSNRQLAVRLWETVGERQWQTPFPSWHMGDEDDVGGEVAARKHNLLTVG